MDRARDQFFTGARLAGDQNGDIDASRLAEDLTSLHHLGTAPQARFLLNSPVALLERLRIGGRAGKVIDYLLELRET
jgi:hypothetical protein